MVLLVFLIALLAPQLLMQVEEGAGIQVLEALEVEEVTVFQVPQILLEAGVLVMEVLSVAVVLVLSLFAPSLVVQPQA